jgi:hypothetical protein
MRFIVTPPLRTGWPLHGQRAPMGGKIIVEADGIVKARYVDTAPDDSFWRVLHRLADKALGGFRRSLLAVLGSVGVSIPRDRLTALTIAGDAEALAQAVQQVWQTVGVSGLQEHVAPQVQALALEAAEVTTLADISVRFNVEDQEALRAIERFTGQRMTAISDTTLEAVRGIIRRAFEAGTPITQQIAEIQELVGLTPKQAESVSRYRQGLLEAGEKPTRIDALVEKRTRALRRQRAESIARTESMAAVHEGQQERWRQAVRDGLMDTGRFRRYLVITPDDRLCPVCAAVPGLNPEGVGLEQPFETPGGSVQHPPIHVMCRCSVSLREVR